MATAQRGWVLVRLPEEELQAEGVRLLDRAVELDGELLDAWIFRGFTYRELVGDAEEAVLSYRTALELDPPPAMRTELQRIIDELTG
jgi:predicted TPR repeat methyltransferase